MAENRDLAPHNPADDHNIVIPQPRLRDIQRPIIAANPSCIRLTAAARNYELKSIHLNQLPTFNGLGAEDALGFMREFYNTVQTFPLNNLTEEELRMRCFPYCMKGDARQWLLNLSEGSLGTWDEIYNAFMFKYYSSQKTMDYRSRICNFTQREGELFHEAWERFKILLIQCPHHQFPLLLLTQFFYDGLTPNCQTLVDTAAGGYPGDKNGEELQSIYANLAINSQQKAVRGRRAAVHEINTQPNISEQMAELTKQMQMLLNRDNSSREVCAMCGLNGHNADFCINAGSTYEEANYMGSYGGKQQTQPQRNDPYSNTYNPGWRNHPNFSWKDPGVARPMGPSGFQQSRPQFQAPQAAPHLPQSQEHKPQFEEMVMQYMTNQDSIIKKLDAKIDHVMQSNQASIHNLEIQVGQLAKTMNERGQGKFPSNTEVNPKEVAMAITLRSGKLLEEMVKEKRKDGENEKKQDPEAEAKHNEQSSVETSKDLEPPSSIIKPYVPPIPYPQRLKKKNQDNNFQRFLEIFKKSEKKQDHAVNENKDEQSPVEKSKDPEPESATVKPYVPPIPYPQRLKKKNQDNNFHRFLEIFKKLQINIPFVEALAHMPSYAKFFKEIISNKKKLEEYASIALTEECSAILQKKLPPKLKDPGSFSIPCTIGNLCIDKCLCDLGASVNLMPLTLFRKLGIKEMKPTTVSLQLADRSVRYPIGIVEDILVKVGKLIFPTDFLVLDLEDDLDVSLILGRPFLLTGGVLIDMPSGKLIFRVGKEREEFRISKAVKFPTFDDSCFSSDVLKPDVHEKLPLGTYITN